MPTDSLPIDPYEPSEELIEFAAKRMCWQDGTSDVDELDAAGKPLWHRYRDAAQSHLQLRGRLTF